MVRATTAVGWGVFEMLNIDITADVREVQRALGSLRGEVDKCAARALNDAARVAKTQAVRGVSKGLNLRRQKNARSSMVVNRAHPRKLIASLVATGKPIPLSDLKGAKATKRGGVRANYWGKSVHVRRGFKYNNTFFKRTGPKRTPIQRLVGPPVPDTLMRKNVSASVIKIGQERAAVRFAHHIDRALKRLGIRK